MDPARPARALARYAVAFLVAACVVGSAGLASAAKPAVKERNIRALARYDYVHVNSDDVNRFAPAPANPNDSFPEIDFDTGTFLGFLTMPVGDGMGARFFAGPATSKRHADVETATKSSGLEFGGDLFFRDPEVGEFGIGPRYSWRETKQGRVDKSAHYGGGEMYGRAFFEGFGFGPVDLDTRTSVLDGDIDIDGKFSEGTVYSAGGGATVYFSDRLAVGLGGSWTRSNNDDGDHLTVSSADIDIDVLLPLPMPVTFGFDVSIGNQDRAASGFDNFGSDFFSIGLGLTISFTEATSLVELSRFYY